MTTRTDLPSQGLVRYVNDVVDRINAYSQGDPVHRNQYGKYFIGWRRIDMDRLLVLNETTFDKECFYLASVEADPVPGVGQWGSL